MARRGQDTQKRLIYAGPDALANHPSDTPGGRTEQDAVA